MVGFPQTFDHVMIDIETMSLHPNNALILSIGMIEFDPSPTETGLQIGDRKLMVLDLNEQIALCRHVDPATQQWWSKQPAEAQAHWRNGDRWSASRAICEVREFCAVRTFVNEHPATRLGPSEELILVAHDPVCDCVYQAWEVWRHWSAA